MPTIREYQQSVGPAGPGNVINAPLSIADSAATKGRVIGEALSQTGAAIQQVGEQIDKSKAHVNLANARATLTIEMQNAVQSGEAASPDFIKRMADRAAKLQEQDGKSYNTNVGSQMAANGWATIASEFSVQANHYQAVAVGQQAALSHKIAVDQDAITLQKDPGQLKSVLNDYLARVQDPSGNFASRLPKQKLDELIQETTERFGVAAMRGAIAIGPELAAQNMKDGAGGAELLSADQRTQMLAEIDRGFRDRDIEDERKLRFEERQQKKQNLQIGDEFFAKNTHGALSIKAIRESPLPWQEKRYWEAAIKEKAEKPDPTAVNHYLNKIIRGEITRDDQLPLLGNGVTYADRQHMLVSLAHGPAGTEKRNAVETAQRFLNAEAYGGLSTFNSWHSEFSEKWDAKVKAKEDPTVLIRQFPGNKEYMITEDRLRAHVQAATSQVEEIVNSDARALAVARAELAKGGGNLPRPATAKEALALGSGAYFIGPQGKLLRNPIVSTQPVESTTDEIQN